VDADLASSREGSLEDAGYDIRVFGAADSGTEACGEIGRADQDDVDAVDAVDAVDLVGGVEAGGFRPWRR
jgi:hypothetical protein